MPKKLFITISPRDRTGAYATLKFKNPLRCVFIDDKQVIEHAFKQYKIKEYNFYPELANGRLHYHGRVTVTPSQEVSLYKAIKPKLQRIGFVDIQPVKHEVENLIYCMKEMGKTPEYLDLDFENVVIGRKGFKSLYSGVARRVTTPNNENLEGLSVLDYFKGI